MRQKNSLNKWVSYHRSRIPVGGAGAGAGAGAVGGVAQICTTCTLSGMSKRGVGQHVSSPPLPSPPLLLSFSSATSNQDEVFIFFFSVQWKLIWSSSSSPSSRSFLALTRCVCVCEYTQETEREGERCVFPFPCWRPLAEAARVGGGGGGRPLHCLHFFFSSSSGGVSSERRSGLKEGTGSSPLLSSPPLSCQPTQPPSPAASHSENFWLLLLLLQAFFLLSLSPCCCTRSRAALSFLPSFLPSPLSLSLLSLPFSCKKEVSSFPLLNQSPTLFFFSSATFSLFSLSLSPPKQKMPIRLVNKSAHLATSFLICCLAFLGDVVWLPFDFACRPGSPAHILLASSSFSPIFFKSHLLF